MAAEFPQANLLGGEASPYLRQHRDNPVHWRPYGAAALAEARETGKPILISIGYAACHWCHVMAHESFEDPAVAAVMNRLFVNIKVDREERPDLDAIYMSALHALGESGGWPLTMFLTADAEPVWGGTYFPPTSRYGRPAFTAVLEEVARIFRNEPGKVDANRLALLQRLRQRSRAGGSALTETDLDAAVATLVSGMDLRAGGLRGAPKFPQASILEALWRAHVRSGDRDQADAVRRTLVHLCQGGIYDHLGGGWARYSTDDRWLVPHFEKMLYDTAQLIERLAYAFVPGTNDGRLFRIRIEESIAWLCRELASEGAFASSLDADSDGSEGRFYVWRPEEIDAVLGPRRGPAFRAVYDIGASGHFEGESIPNRLHTPVLFDDTTEADLAADREKLLAARENRPRPARDDKVLADWNGLAIAAIAVAAMRLERPAWLATAVAAYRSVMAKMVRYGRVAHAWLDGRLTAPGFSSDAAAMTKAALALHAATADPAYLEDAEAFAAALRVYHWDDGAGGYFLSADDAGHLIVRPKSGVDDAQPSPNGLMAETLVRLWRLTGKDAYRADADAILGLFAIETAENPFAHAGMLNALDQRLNATDVVVVLAQDSATTSSDLVDAVRRNWRETLTLSVHLNGRANLPPGHPAHGKTAMEGSASAYVCRAEHCSLPVTDVAALLALL